MPLCTFDSCSLPQDSLGLDLSGFDETQESASQCSLSLPSEPPELDLEDWIQTHTILKNLRSDQSNASQAQRSRHPNPSEKEFNETNDSQKEEKREISETNEKRDFKGEFLEKNALLSQMEVFAEKQALDIHRSPKRRRTTQPLKRVKKEYAEVEKDELNNAGNKGEDAGTVDSETQEKLGHNSSEETETQCKFFPLKSSTGGSSRERSSVSLSSRTRSNRGILRRPLSECGNIPRDEQQTGKWLCPRKHKKPLQPSRRQLYLDKWLAPPR